MSAPFCPFDIHDIPPTRGFSLGFQSLCICKDCTAEAVAGNNQWRWQPGQQCFRCMQKDVSIYLAAPTNIQIGLCERCLNAGHAYLTGAVEIPDPVKPPRRLTKAEQNSGNL